jgi:predicted transcriptional regulator
MARSPMVTIITWACPNIKPCVVVLRFLNTEVRKSLITLKP